MEVSGKVILVTPTEQVTEKVKKRELILECGDNPQYMQKVKFEAINDRCAALDGIQQGQDVTVYFNLNGRDWVNKEGKTQYFNTLSIWKVDKGNYQEHAEPSSSTANDDSSDLPF